MDNKLRIFYAAGAGNIICTYNYWIKGEDDPSQVAITYSGQFYELCRQLDAEFYAISPVEDRQVLRGKNFTIEHRSFPLRQASGILYHLGMLWYGLRLVVSAIKFKADVAIVADGTTHWFLLALLSWFNIQVIPSLHCVLWRKYVPPSKAQKFLLNLSRYLFINSSATIVVSNEIAEQVAQIAGVGASLCDTTYCHGPIIKSYPVYRRTEFHGMELPNLNRYPFRIVFVGRIEANKGVFDILEIAKRFVSEGRKDFVFEVCGSGSALESLRLAVKESELEDLFICHGYCNKSQMRQIYGQSHAVIVPTKTDFVEGFNKVVAESILAGRPVVTSAVCPAISEVRSAVVEVPPDDIKAYGDALIKLSEDREFYQEKQRNCSNLQEKFYDYSQSWGAQLKFLISSLQLGTKLMHERQLQLFNDR